MKNALLIYSGGMDSTSMLYEYRDSIALALSFDYGSRHNEREIACASYNCRQLGIRHVVIPLAFMQQYFRSALLKGGDDIPTGQYNDENMHSTVVPFRNGIMLAIAAGMAESEGLTTVMMANHSGDHAIYPDCRPQFVDAMDAAIAAGTYEGIRLVTPYTHLTKTEIAQRGAQHGVDFAHTYSCYNGGEQHCGQCATCQERRQALADAGLNDPTCYKKIR